jgi:Do/DeqQ family serine protease
MQTMMYRHFLGTFLLSILLTASALQAKAPPLSAGNGIVTIAPMLEQVTPAVVSIAVESQQPASTNPLFSDPFFRDFFDAPPQPDRSNEVPVLSAGSGVIVDAEEGYVLTNAHVVENGTRILVTLTDGRRLEATVIGVDAATDIAVLQIQADGLVGLPFGDSEALRVGDYVVAVGNPFGLGQTVTSGIVSALGRSGINPEGYEDFIQTDASINPGNSGGALVTLDGRLVGINTAIIAPSGGNIGIGFAVPVNMARRVMDQLIVFGEVRRGRLGVVIQDLTPALAEALGIDLERGAIVSNVEPGSPAARAGLAQGDVITAIDGSAVDNASDLRNRIGIVEAGRPVDVTYVRDDVEKTISILVEARGDQQTAQTRRHASDRLQGASLSALEPGMAGFGDVEGVAVLAVERNSKAERSGLRPGDIILAVNRVPVVAPNALLDAVSAAGDGPVALTVHRGGSNLYLLLQ